VINIRKISPTISVGILDLKVFGQGHLNMLKRDLEKAGSLFLLSELLNTKEFELNYTPANKPFLKDQTKHISISHSHDKLAIIIDENHSTGIDIELMRDKVLKIQHKFLNPTELTFARDHIERLITIWAAKEALYKVYGLKEVDFIKNLFVEDFDGDDIFGKIDIGSFKKRYKLRSENLDGYKLVYVLNEL
jgi:4'-phosphopantetheinyl transferase